MINLVHDRVIAIIARQALVDVSLLSLETQLTDLGLDSLGLVEVIFGIEETFDISVPFNANAPGEGFDVATVGSVVAGVDALLAAKPA